MRSAAAVALVLALAGCGGEPTDHSPGAPTAVLADFVLAVRGGDSERTLGYLSRRFVERYDLTEKKVKSSFIPAVRADMGPVGEIIELAFEETIDPDLAVAALRDASARPAAGPRAYASPLVREQGNWKVEPFGLDMSYGYPDDFSSDSSRPFISFGVNTAGDPEGHLWVDGNELPLKKQPGTPITFEARPAEPLEAGRHLVVAFAAVGDRAGALAWLLTVR